MKRALLAVAIVCIMASAAVAASVRGVLLNDDDPYFVKAEDGTIYECEWYGGSSTWWKGDTVLLTKNMAFAQMVGLTGLSEGKTSKVWVEEK